MKTAVIFYHKNIGNYPKEWIEQCKISIKNQTYKDFDVFELNYGNDNIQHFNDVNGNKYVFYDYQFNNYVGAMNFLFSQIFSMGYDVIFNTNIDDQYESTRFEKQLVKIEDGYQLISSNFYYTDETGNNIINKLCMTECGDIGENLNKEHNIIAHPSVCMHSSFWDDDLHYNESLAPKEDLDLWKRAYNKGKLFCILPEYLLRYRIHQNQVSNVNAVMPTKVNLLIIATNKYIVFLSDLLDSADLYFLKDTDVIFNVFTDKIQEAKKLLLMKPYFNKIKFLKIEHKPWPYSTLHRFDFFKRYESELNVADFNFYIDADCIIKKEITTDILSDRTAVQHCGFNGRRGTYETNPKSTSYVSSKEGTTYFGGGFWGFSKTEFLKLLNTAIKMINTDETNGITPLWHDESVLNRYLIDNPPVKILSSSYHFPQEVKCLKYLNYPNINFECIILLLDKNHKEFQS